MKPEREAERSEPVGVILAVEFLRAPDVNEGTGDTRQRLLAAVTVDMKVGDVFVIEMPSGGYRPP